MRLISTANRMARRIQARTGLPADGRLIRRCTDLLCAVDMLAERQPGEGQKWAASREQWRRYTGQSYIG